MSTPLVVPPSLAPGSQYRLVFVTDGKIASTSANISTYNTFAASEAALSPNLVSLNSSWRAVASTATVSAKANTSTDSVVSAGVPIYALDGSLVADNYVGFWSGTLRRTININQFGTPRIKPAGTNLSVWTGTTSGGERPPGGTPYTPWALGQGNTVVVGNSSHTNFGWASIGLETSGILNPIYAISDILVAPTIADLDFLPDDWERKYFSVCD
jgi:hypothetical protein